MVSQCSSIFILLISEYVLNKNVLSFQKYLLIYCACGLSNITLLYQLFKEIFTKSSRRNRYTPILITFDVCLLVGNNKSELLEFNLFKYYPNNTCYEKFLLYKIEDMFHSKPSGNTIVIIPVESTILLQLSSFS